MGNSDLHFWEPDLWPVHPHVHGELVDRTPRRSRDPGSSPRAWGTHFILFPYKNGFRFIPTCMGNSRVAGKGIYGSAVHPHVHGELSLPKVTRAILSGSSPRAWGTLCWFLYQTRYPRFIPTCMGNSIPITRNGLYRPVHPHVHGELTRKPRRSVSVLGSSPRAWGTRSGGS